MADYVLAISQDIEKLSARAEEVGFDRDHTMITTIIKELKETIRANKDLVALSAPQIGYPHRIFCINFNNDIRAFINPVITETEGFSLVREKSPSIPNKEFIVPRNEVVYATYQKTNGQPESNKFIGVVAETFQHQVDLLDGVLISDFGLEVIPEFDSATDEEQQAVVLEYLNHLKEQSEKLNQEIENDSDLKKISDGAKFFTALVKGEVSLEVTKKEEETTETIPSPDTLN